MSEMNNTENLLILKYGTMAMTEILKHGNKARYTQILRGFPASSSTLSRVLMALEKNRLIKREVDPSSRPPVAYYSVTDNGEDIIQLLTMERNF